MLATGSRWGAGRGTADGLVSFEPRRRHRRRSPVVSADQLEPPSMFHLLHSDDEVQDALERAAGFERAAADVLRHRAERYEAEMSDHRGDDRESH